VTKEKNRGRYEKRVCKIYNNFNGIDRKKWKGLKSLVKVDRITTNKKKISKETAYFISSLRPSTSAKIFSEGIRSHWQIESFHYIKDVTFKEDQWKVKTKNAPANYSLIRNIAINIFRNNNLENIQEATEKCANNIPFIMSLI